MKTHALVFFMLASALALRADDTNGGNLLQNGDFTDGMDHWHGSARLPADMAPSDPFAKPDPLYSQGLIIPLHPETWVKVEQEFQTKIYSLKLSITYKVSPDFTISTKPDDYTNVASKINYPAYLFFNFQPGKWLALLTDLNGIMSNFNSIKPKTGTTDPQTFNRVLDSGMFAGTSDDKTLCLAFPPGTGNVVLLDVSLTDANGSPTPTP